MKDAPILVLGRGNKVLQTLKMNILLQEALSELVKDKTVIMIAHRLNTIEYANQILVISDGKLQKEVSMKI